MQNSKKAKEYSKITSLSSKDTELLDSLFGDEMRGTDDKKTQPDTLSEVKNAPLNVGKQFDEFVNGKSSKALLMHDGKGVWYCYDRILVRMYRDIITGNVLRLQSCVAGSSGRRFVMENGLVINISHESGKTSINMTFSNTTTLACTDLEWIEPLTSEQLLNYKL